MVPLVDSSDEEPMSAEPASSSTAPRRRERERESKTNRVFKRVTGGRNYFRRGW